MSKLYSCLPSDIIGIEDSYTAFCFNEACAVITTKLMNDEKPRYREIGREQNKKTYSSFTDYYKTIE